MNEHVARQGFERGALTWCPDLLSALEERQRPTRARRWSICTQHTEESTVPGTTGPVHRKDQKLEERERERAPGAQQRAEVCVCTQEYSLYSYLCVPKSWKYRAMWSWND